VPCRSRPSRLGHVLSTANASSGPVRATLNAPASSATPPVDLLGGVVNAVVENGAALEALSTSRERVPVWSVMECHEEGPPRRRHSPVTNPIGKEGRRLESVTGLSSPQRVQKVSVVRRDIQRCRFAGYISGCRDSDPRPSAWQRLMGVRAPFARVRRNLSFAAASGRASERQRTRANAEPCHSCHASVQARTASVTASQREQDLNLRPPG
jgi:hypothetical protein